MPYAIHGYLSRVVSDGWGDIGHCHLPFHPMLLPDDDNNIDHCLLSRLISSKSLTVWEFLETLILSGEVISENLAHFCSGVDSSRKQDSPLGVPSVTRRKCEKTQTAPRTQKFGVQELEAFSEEAPTEKWCVRCATLNHRLSI